MPPLTEAEIRAIRAILAGVGEGALTTELAAKINAAFDDNIKTGSVSGTTLGLRTREGDSVNILGAVPSVPDDLINREALATAIAGVRQIPGITAADEGKYLIAGSTTAVWRAFEDTPEGSWRLGTNVLVEGVPLNTAGLRPVRTPFSLDGTVVYALVFSSVGAGAIQNLVFAIGDNRPKGANGGSYVFTQNGLSITDGFDGALVGVHRIVGRGPEGPRGRDGSSVLNISDDLLTQSLATNGSSRRVTVPVEFTAPKGVFIGTQTPTHGYEDHMILMPFLTVQDRQAPFDQNVYLRNGIGFSFPDTHTIRADSGLDANDRITSWRYFQ